MIDRVEVREQQAPAQMPTLRLVQQPHDAQAEIIRLADLLRDVATKLTLLREVALTQMVTLDHLRQQRAATLANALLLEAGEAVSHAEDAVQDLARAKRAAGRL